MKLDIMTVLLAVLIFVAVVGTLVTSVDNAAQGNAAAGEAGLNGSGLTLAGLLPLFAVIGVVVYVVRRAKAGNGQ